MKVKAALRQERRFLNLDFSDAQRGSKSVRLNSVDQRKGASKSISCIYAPPLLHAGVERGTEAERGEKAPCAGAGRGHKSGKLWKKPRAREWSGGQKKERVEKAPRARAGRGHRRRKRRKKPRAREWSGGTKAESC